MKLNNTQIKINPINPNFNNLNINDNKPVLFSKKINKTVIKPLTYNKSTTGLIRHFTPAAQEWFNSVYSYDLNYNKDLSVLDTNLLKTLKSYFNLKIQHKFFKEKRMPIRFKRMCTKKVYVGRGDIKHTSKNIIITFCVHNTEKMFLQNAYNKTRRALYWPRKRLIKTLTIKDEKEVISYNRPLSLKEYSSLPDHYNIWYTDYVLSYIEIKNLFLINLILQYKILTKLVILKIISMEDKNEMFIDLFHSNVDNYNHPSFSKYKKLIRDFYKQKYEMYRYLLAFNRVKFKPYFMLKLTQLVEKMYRKKVVFNIINLKKLHHSSDIFTQVVSMKLKNRNNRMYRVLKYFFRKIKIREINKLFYKGYKYNKNELLSNKIRNKYVISMFNNKSKDYLSDLLLKFIPSANDIKVDIKKKSTITKKRKTLLQFVLSVLKHITLRGIRVEAKGRLSRRFTASRSMFKVKWKGGLKNVDSSFKGMSAILLRGHAKSNVENSFVSSKNRNGAFGVKGWVSVR